MTTKPATTSVKHNRKASTTRKRRGRPTICTPAVVDSIVQAVSVGAHRKHAAARAGVSLTALDDWLRRGENALQAAGYDVDTEHIDLDDPELADVIHPDDLRYVQLRIRYLQAEGTVFTTLAGKIAANPDWRAAAWLLERRARTEYPRPGLEITGADGGPLLVATVREQLLDKVGRYEPPGIIDVELGRSTPKPLAETNGEHE